MSVDSLFASTLTWRNGLKVLFAIIAEYSVLAMIEDAPFLFKAGSAIIATMAVIILWLEDWLSGKYRYIFHYILIALGIIYLVFLAYAIIYAMTKAKHLSQLEIIYSDIDKLMGGAIPNNMENAGMSDAAIDKLEFESGAWEQATAEWLAENIGPGARARFLERSRMPTYCWDSKCGRRYANIMNRLLNEQNNLSVIRETGIYR